MYDDESEVLFFSGLGICLGRAVINKKDIELIKEFGRKSEFTNVSIDGDIVTSDENYNCYNGGLQNGN